MTAALLAFAAALAIWPAPRHRFAPRAKRPGSRRRWAAVVPELLGVLVGLTVVAWQSSVFGIVAAVGVAVVTTALLRRARRRPREAASDPAIPLVLVVAGLLLRSGTPPTVALAQAARGCKSAIADACDAVDRRVAMGECPTTAWAALHAHPDLAPVGRAAIRASDSGAALAQAWEATADQKRADRRIAREIAARKVGVQALAPLGLCFLPSFICLGVIPIVIGLAGDIL